MSIVTLLKEVIESEEKKVASSQAYLAEKEFLEKLEKEGLLERPVYSLPTVDTIGRRLYQSLAR